MKNRGIKVLMVGVTSIFTCLTILGHTASEGNRPQEVLAAFTPGPAPADGGALYAKYCSRCHGDAGNALVDFCSPNWQKTHTDAKIASTIRNGKDGTSMPSFKSYLGPSDVSALVHRIRSFAKRK